MLAREGATLEEMHQKLERIEHRPDVLIIFAGHNEFQARFPWDQDGDRPGGLLPYALKLVMQDRTAFALVPDGCPRRSASIG